MVYVSIAVEMRVPTWDELEDPRVVEATIRAALVAAGFRDTDVDDITVRETPAPGAERAAA
jgi:hypothetical protein